MRCTAAPPESHDAALLQKICQGQVDAVIFFSPSAVREFAQTVGGDAFRQIGGVDPALHYALDYDLWIRLSRVGAPVAFARKIALSRMHPANKTLGSRRAAYEETMKVLKRHYDYVPYDWVVAHANHVADRRDGFFQESRASRLNVLASLAVGLFINSKQWGRYLRDWLAHRRFRTNRN